LRRLYLQVTIREGNEIKFKSKDSVKRIALVM